jgi:signal transduction histidine kinase
MKIRLVPHSLAVRIFLIMAGGIIASTFLARWVVESLYTGEIEKLGRNSAIERIGGAVRVLDSLPRAQRAAAARGMQFDRLRVSWPTQVGPLTTLEPAVAELFRHEIRRYPGQIRFDALDPGPCSTKDSADCDKLAKLFVAELSLTDGQPVRIEYTTRYFVVDTGEWLIPWVIGIGALVLVVWISMRIATRPLRELAAHAEGLGRDLNRDPLDENGPSEVRHAAQAFNAMQARIRRHIDERTQMLAAITHDLKTPLTRQKLRLEQIADPHLRHKFGEDVEAMRRLIEEGLELARSLDTSEETRRIDIAALLETLAEDAREAGENVRFFESASLVVEARPQALRRVFMNLIDNAVKYGGGAEIRLASRAAQLRVSIRDHGPGIPDEHLDDVLKPYFRLEASRSRETGGSGLGLAIAANLLAAQHGNLALRNHPEGGLEAVVALPLSA